MDAKSGEILALASKPDFDPNEYCQAGNRLWHPRFLDPYEPGSTFKLIATASGLQDGVITLDSKVKALDQLEIGGKVIKNSHDIKWPGADDFHLHDAGAIDQYRRRPDRPSSSARNDFTARSGQFGFGERDRFRPGRRIARHRPALGRIGTSRTSR